MAVIEPKRMPKFVHDFLFETPKGKVVILGKTVEWIRQPVGGNHGGDPVELGFTEDEGQHWNKKVDPDQSNLLFVRLTEESEQLGKEGCRVVLTTRSVERPIETKGGRTHVCPNVENLADSSGKLLQPIVPDIQGVQDIDRRNHSAALSLARFLQSVFLYFVVQGNAVDLKDFCRP